MPNDINSDGSRPAWMDDYDPEGKATLVIEIEYTPEDLADALRFLGSLGSLGAEINDVEAI